MDFTNVITALNRHGFLASAYETAEQATGAALAIIGGRSVGSGGSRTIGELGMLDCLNKNGNTVYCHSLVADKAEKAEKRKQAMHADVYLSSVNAVTEDGALFNIDGTGNRVAAMLFGPETVIVIAGRNKLAPDYQSAIERTRRDCCPSNARRLGLKTPCAETDICTECNSPARMCRSFVNLVYPTRNVKEFYVLLVDQDLGW